MNRRVLILGIPATTWLLANSATVRAQASAARARIQGVQSQLSEIERQIRQTINSTPTLQEVDVFAIRPDLGVADAAIRDTTYDILDSISEAERRDLALPQYRSLTSFTPDYGGLRPQKADVVPIRDQPPISRRSARRRVDRVVEIIAEMVGLEEIVADLIFFIRQHPATRPHIEQVERAIELQDQDAFYDAVKRLLTELFTTAAGDLIELVGRVGGTRLTDRLVRRAVVRFVPILGTAILVYEVARAAKAMAREIYGV